MGWNDNPLSSFIQKAKSAPVVPSKPVSVFVPVQQKQQSASSRSSSSSSSSVSKTVNNPSSVFAPIAEAQNEPIPADVKEDAASKGFGKVTRNLNQGGYVYSLSDEQIQKTNVAGSPENYDKYLDIVRSHPEFVALHSISTPYLGLDLAFASNKLSSTGASEREEILIKQLHEWKGSPESKGDVVRMWTNAIPNNPFVQIAGSEAAGFVLGKVAGGASGRIVAKYGPKGVKWFNRGQLIAGGVIATPQAIDMGETAYKGEWGKFAGKSIMFGATFVTGMEGYKSGGAAPITWGKYKGLNSYQAGVSKTINNPKFDSGKVKFFNNLLAKDVTVVKSDFNPTRIKMTNAKYSITQDLYNKRVNPKFPDTTLKNVESLNKLDNAPKKGLKNTILGMTRKRNVEGYGGAFSPKDSTHDVDLAFKSGKEPTILNDIMNKLGIGKGKVVDTHKMLSVGERTELLGATRKTSDITESGVHRINAIDQFDRISEGAVFSPAKREDKDIVNSINLIKKIYAKQYPGGIPKDSALKIKNFEDVYTQAGKTKDFIISESSEKQIYNSGKIWEYQQKFYKKILPESYLKKKFNEYTKYPKEYLEGAFNKKPYDPIARLIKSSPDVSTTISPSLRSSRFFMIPSFFNRSSDVVKSISIPSVSSSRSSKSVSESSVISPSFNPYSPSKSPPSSPPYYPSKSPPSSPPYSPSKSPPFPSSSYFPPYYPYSPKLYGRGSRGFEWKAMGTKYSFRKASYARNPFDVPSIKEMKF